MIPNERDLEKARKLAKSVVFDWEPEGHPSDYENLGNDIAEKVANALAAERASLPYPVVEYIETCANAGCPIAESVVECLSKWKAGE